MSAPHLPQPLEHPAHWPVRVLTEPPSTARKGTYYRIAAMGVAILCVALFVGTLAYTAMLPHADRFGQYVREADGSWTFRSPLFWPSFWTAYVQPVLGVVLVTAAAVLWRRGTHLRAVSSWRFLQDRRPPVLYLRSFPVDRAFDISPRLMPNPLGDRYEARLLGVVGRLGPCVALGRPSERLPEAGADRVYVADEDWQGAVRFVMAQAAAVVIVVDDSPGLLWEVATSVTSAPPHRILFCFPYLGQREVARHRWSYRSLVPYAPMSSRIFPRVEADRQRRYEVIRRFVAPSVPFALPDSLGSAQYLTFCRNGRPVLLETRQSRLQRLMTFIAVARVLPLSWPVAAFRASIDLAGTIDPFLAANRATVDCASPTRR